MSLFSLPTSSHLGEASRDMLNESGQVPINAATIRLLEEFNILWHLSPLTLQMIG